MFALIFPVTQKTKKHSQLLYAIVVLFVKFKNLFEIQSFSHILEYFVTPIQVHTVHLYYK